MNQRLLTGIHRNLGSLILVLCVLGWSNGFAQAFEEFSGVETFHRFCASCHGSGGIGDGPVAPALPITVPDLSTLKQRYGEDFNEHLLRRIIDGRSAVIYHGTRFMPVWGYEFWIEEGADEAAAERVEVIIGNLIEYIDSIQQE